MNNICVDCTEYKRRQVARSDYLAVNRCHCGQYWLTFADTPTQPATARESALAEIVEALARLRHEDSIEEVI